MLYNPDRLRNAVTQQPRGSQVFTPLQWDAALATVTERIQNAKPGGVAYYGRAGDDSLAAIVTPFIQALGGPAPVYYDGLSAMNGRRLLARVMGEIYGIAPNLPFFDISHADVVLSFGANFTETWLSPVAYGKAFGEMRGQPLGKRGNIHPVRAADVIYRRHGRQMGSHQSRHGRPDCDGHREDHRR